MLYMLTEQHGEQRMSIQPWAIIDAIVFGLLFEKVKGGIYMRKQLFTALESALTLTLSFLLSLCSLVILMIYCYF